MTHKPLVIAHRGACGYRPEHSGAAYELAIEHGADMLEPDVVATSDGVLVIRHENEISGTTDVADHPEFADRRTVKIVDNQPLDGWFTEDFTWNELSTLRCRERLPQSRLESRAFDGQCELLRLTDLLHIVDSASRPVSLCIELKHATYFDEEGLRLDSLLARDLRAAGWALDDERLVLESFEKTILVRMRDAGLGAQHAYLLEHEATAFDELLWAATEGVPPLSYGDELSEAGLEAFMGRMTAISVDARFLIDPRTGDISRGIQLVRRAHSLGLQVFAWTLRPENEFLPLPFRQGTDSSAWGDYATAWSAVMQTNVDAVFADHPDLAIAVRDGL
ncbi:MAG: glycerophosphodiester phosphodiesterase [Microbacteriaceae bacterium]|nr:glycerophosphodiester phosphodiesterase [Microbacteriaceae bacterium]